MSKSSVIKLVGSLAAMVVAGGGLAFPPQYRDLAIGLAGMILTALHVQRPGDVKAGA